MVEVAAEEILLVVPVVVVALMTALVLAAQNPLFGSGQRTTHWRRRLWCVF